MVVTSHMWLLSTYKVANVTEELNFIFLERVGEWQGKRGRERES